MNGLALADSERVRLLAAMGFETWRRRDPNVTPTLAPEIAQSVPVRSAPGSRSSAPKVAASLIATPTLPKQSVVLAAAPRTLPASPQRRIGDAVLLVLENRREADAPLLRALALILPGCTICTPDTVPSGAARFAVQVGIAAPLPCDVLGVRVPSLSELRGSAAARRALWWAIKPLLKPLQT